MNIGELKTIEKWLLRGGSTSTREPDSDNADVGIDSQVCNCAFLRIDKGFFFCPEELFFYYDRLISTP